MSTSASVWSPRYGELPSGHRYARQDRDRSRRPPLVLQEREDHPTGPSHELPCDGLPDSRFEGLEGAAVPSNSESLGSWTTSEGWGHVSKSAEERGSPVPL